MIQCTRQHTVTHGIGFLWKNFNEKYVAKPFEVILQESLGIFYFDILIFFMTIPLIGSDTFVLVIG